MPRPEDVKSTTQYAKRLWRQFHGCNSPVVAHVKLTTSQNKLHHQSNRLGEYVQYSHTQYSFLVMPDEKEKTKKERRTKLKFSCLVFLTLLKVSITFSVD